MAVSRIYEHSLGLLTDLYQLTMAHGYWMCGIAEREAVFHLTYRQNPFGGGYAVSCGLEYAIDWLSGLRFTDGDLDYLAGLRGADDGRLFDPRFLDYLQAMSISLDVDAPVEGTVVFPHEPLIRVRGPLLQAQIVESGLLAMINFQTLVATKASRICRATGGDSVLEFGLRRAQGIDGGIAASRAAYIGGCAATSNVLAGKLFGIPVRGTHAHSWVMSFDDELEAFDQYAEAMPNNCVFLVDTFDTIEGVKKAIQAGNKLRQRGFEMIGIRLDSGQLAMLSKQARSLLDAAGFADASIVASNDLDEYQITDLKNAGAEIDVWGVGTRLVTAYDQPALGGVYKLAAIRDAKNRWHNKIKLSEQTLKTSNPGIQQVRRYQKEQRFLCDVIYHEPTGVGPRAIRSDSKDIRTEEMQDYSDLLVPVLRQGRSVYDTPHIHDIRRYAKGQLEQLPETYKSHQQPRQYPVGLDESLYDMKQRLVEEARSTNR